jgi:endonuclease/exonuclease/phosphatase family metal-dependent hydrolase
LERLGDFLRTGPAAVAGDFNDASSGLEMLGFESAYHRLHRVKLGAEREPTLYLRRREGLPRHRDLVFLDPQLSRALREVEVGAKTVWAGASDHAPVLAVIDTSALIT